MPTVNLITKDLLSKPSIVSAGGSEAGLASNVGLFETSLFSFIANRAQTDSSSKSPLPKEVSALTQAIKEKSSPNVSLDLSLEGKKVEALEVTQEGGIEAQLTREDTSIALPDSLQINLPNTKPPQREAVSAEAVQGRDIKLQGDASVKKHGNKKAEKGSTDSVPFSAGTSVPSLPHVDSMLTVAQTSPQVLPSLADGMGKKDTLKKTFSPDKASPTTGSLSPVRAKAKELEVDSEQSTDSKEVETAAPSHKEALQKLSIHEENQPLLAHGANNVVGASFAINEIQGAVSNRAQITKEPSSSQQVPNVFASMDAVEVPSPLRRDLEHQDASPMQHLDVHVLGAEHGPIHIRAEYNESAEVKVVATPESQESHEALKHDLSSLRSFLQSEHSTSPHIQIAEPVRTGMSFYQSGERQTASSGYEEGPSATGKERTKPGAGVEVDIKSLTSENTGWISVHA